MPALRAILLRVSSLRFPPCSRVCSGSDSDMKIRLWTLFGVRTLEPHEGCPDGPIEES
jgi:hypothetical protein